MSISFFAPNTHIITHSPTLYRKILVVLLCCQTSFVCTTSGSAVVLLAQRQDLMNIYRALESAFNLISSPFPHVATAQTAGHSAAVANADNFSVAPIRTSATTSVRRTSTSVVFPCSNVVEMEFHRKTLTNSAMRCRVGQKKTRHLSHAMREWKQMVFIRSFSVRSFVGGRGARSGHTFSSRWECRTTLLKLTWTTRLYCGKVGIVSRRSIKGADWTNWGAVFVRAFLDDVIESEIIRSNTSQMAVYVYIYSYHSKTLCCLGIDWYLCPRAYVFTIAQNNLLHDCFKREVYI